MTPSAQPGRGSLRAGFAKVDITPRLGVELAGFGPYLLRRAVGIRDRLWARAMILSNREETLIVVNCDLIAVGEQLTAVVREQVAAECGVPPHCLMLTCSHTHSGPATIGSGSWGMPDPVYLELLPTHIVRACREALENQSDTVQAGIAETPCQAIGVNRIHETDGAGASLPLEEVLHDDWRPSKPELTDTTCKILTFHSGDQLLGFAANFGCHPVTCCAETRFIHGDFPGIAINTVEREFPGAVGLFLPGALGDVNSCVVHQPEQESLHALEVISARFANSLRHGIAAAEPFEVDGLHAVSNTYSFTRRKPAVADLETRIEACRRHLATPGATSEDRETRSAVMLLHSLRKVLQTLENSDESRLSPPQELQILRVGLVTIFGAPFEIYQNIKNDLFNHCVSSHPWLVSLANSCMGYAQSKDRVGCGDYADTEVPFIFETLPFAAIHQELLEHFLELEQNLLHTGHP